MILQKRLKSSTVISEDLYVQRSADVQLRNVVENMGRPGYVLVARQMGKTNLLLHAKRTLKSAGDIFLYVDLSNAFPTLDEFFRNIIDLAIDANPAEFDLIQDLIHANREKKRGIPAHKEHEQELRILLNAVPGKIVICLDEIDALTKSVYSDNVFSLIRSIYFAARVNFPEFNRLTYILSGVAEPAEIIKNKDISPFNIGEKIYLEDFTFDEFLNFVEKSELLFEKSVVDRIYYWTSGNPRMCWDLCSAIEDRMIDGEIVNNALVDAVVRRLYLTNFNLPPVDHIRQLVTDDRETRTSIVNIHANRHGTISDQQRTKLYLSGIINANFLSKEIFIKNRIIEETLNLTWLDSIGSSKITLKEQAEKSLQERDYLSALSLYTDYAKSVTSPTDIALVHYNIGECCIRLEFFAQAIENLLLCVFKKSEFAGLYYRQHAWLGLAYYKIGNTEKSIESFKLVVGSEYSDGYPVFYFEALVNVCAPYFDKFEEYSSEIISSSSRVILSRDEILSMDASAATVESIICAAYRNLAIAYVRLERRAEAVSTFAEAIQFASGAPKLALIYQFLKILSSDEKAPILLEASKVLAQDGLAFSTEVSKDQFHFSEHIYADILLEGARYADKGLREKLIAPLLSGKFGEFAAWTVLAAAGFHAINVRDFDTGNDFLTRSLALPLKKTIISERKPVVDYALLTDIQSSRPLIEDEFITGLIASSGEELTERDLRLSYLLVDKFLKTKYIHRARAVINAVLSKKAELLSSGSEKIQAYGGSFVAIDFLNVRLLLDEKDRVAAEAKARLLKTELDGGLVASSLFPANQIDVMKSDVTYLLGAFDAKPYRAESRKIGRNELIKVRLADGSILHGKYKLFVDEIASGKYTIIS